MDHSHTHGDLSWLELTTTDADSAKEFYGSVFGWQLEEVRDDEEASYTVVKVGERRIGGIVTLPPHAEDVAPSWHSYVTVDDVDAVADRVRRSGGAVCSGPHDVPGVGRLIVLTDPQGAKLCAIQYVEADAEAETSAAPA